MIDTSITLFGLLILIRYQPRDENYIEWRVIHKTTEYTEDLKLLDELLKVHYGAYIERILRQHYYWHMEEKATAFDPNEPPF